MLYADTVSLTNTNDKNEAFMHSIFPKKKSKILFNNCLKSKL